MKFSGFGLLSGVVAFASVAVAQDCVATALTAIPSCAQSCFLNGAPSVGCGGTDFVCQCDKQAALFAAVEGCVKKDCPTPSHQAVIDGASAVCKCAAGAVKTAGGSNTVAPSVTATSKPSTVPTAAANRQQVGMEAAIVAGVFGGTLWAALAL